MNDAAAVREAARATPWNPFRHGAFTIMWSATLLSNIGTWMNDVGAGWLMTTLAPSPLLVALVQAATTLPVFLFALPAGALADILDRRRLLLLIQLVLALIALALGLIVLTGRMTAAGLVAFTFGAGMGAAFMAPAWQAIVPQLVPKADLSAAIALNSVGINVSRAIGPALGGAVIVAMGVAWPFLINAASFLAVIGALLLWRPPQQAKKALPAERFVGAMRTGLRYTRASSPLKATLARAIAFFLFASAYWALLPLIARQRLGGGAELYGILVACIGGGAVAGALLLPQIRKRVGIDRLVALGTVGTVCTLIVFALANEAFLAAGACLIGGVSWIAVLSSLNVSAQMSLPDWVRARGLSAYNAVFFGAMALGSLIWGQVATWFGIPGALLTAAAGALLGIGLSWRFRLQAGGTLDLAPSSHWPHPIVAEDSELNSGPVMVTVEYRIDPARVQGFLAAIAELEGERRRGGAFACGLFRDAATPGRFLEYFMEDSWSEHLRHHERVTHADRHLQAHVNQFHVGDEPPRVTHYLPSDVPAPKRSD